MKAPAPPPITPRTKVSELLDAYPELERVLVEMAPPFEKLRNPVLRRTIVRVTTLGKAASIAGVRVRDLVVTLRRAAGQPVDDEDLGPLSDETDSDGGPADWVEAARVVWTLDADQLLDAGVQPITEAQNRASGLRNDELGLIRSSFRPTPLIDLLEQKGHRTAVVRSGDHYATFVAGPATDPERAG